MVAEHQPATLAAMEGLFHGQTAAPLLLLGQPNEVEGKVENPLEVPGMLSMLTYQRWDAHVRGLDASPGKIGRATFHSFTTAITSWWAWGRSLSQSWRSRCFALAR